jgi:hypothetical protein
MRNALCGSILVALLAAGAFAAPRAGRAEPEARRHFVIEVVDDKTGRGVPLVELRTTNGIRCLTDSAGLVAFHEPGLMNRDVFFHVTSHGYEFPADGFGFRGRALRATPGKTARLKIRRKNVAERLYRITGQGIYRDTLLAGRRAPIKQPLLNGRVLGQDSTQAAVYRGMIYWFWGDTARESYPLGHFAMAGATSRLPSKGGLDPSVGVDLTYFVDEKGFSRKMAPLPGPGMIWIDALMTLKDRSGRERLVGHYGRMKSLGERLEHGMAVFNDKTQTFERRVKFEMDTRLEPAYQPLRVTVGGQSYCYFTPSAYPFVRVKADWDHVLDPESYEAFTCLAPGSGYDKDSPKLHRDAGGRLVWSWKPDTAALDAFRQQELIRRGKIKPSEAWIKLRDVETGKPVHAHRGSVRWNAFRKRWVMILGQAGGETSYLGEIWYAEADAPEGPWLAARKIVTHDHYTFYNPVHHAFFDQQGGRVIYFEGTYSHTFSATKVPTPRYDYNQIMYRLDLSDPRLAPAQRRPARKKTK